MHQRQNDDQSRSCHQRKIIERNERQRYPQRCGNEPENGSSRWNANLPEQNQYVTRQSITR